jgi:hypothetical protein
VSYGYAWCGNYASFSALTKCDQEIRANLCKVTIVKDKVSHCYDSELNPNYLDEDGNTIGNRVTHATLKEMHAASGGGLWD